MRSFPHCLSVEQGSAGAVLDLSRPAAVLMKVDKPIPILKDLGPQKDHPRKTDGRIVAIESHREWGRRGK